MKKNDLDQFKLSLNINIEIDANLRRITEMIKLLSMHRNYDALQKISQLLGNVAFDADCFVSETLVSDEE